MKNVQVKPGKPSKFYVNNKRVCLNTAFGMYQNGAKFTVNGKKLKLNKFGVDRFFATNNLDKLQGPGFKATGAERRALAQLDGYSSEDSEPAAAADNADRDPNPDLALFLEEIIQDLDKMKTKYKKMAGT